MIKPQAIIRIAENISEKLYDRNLETLGNWVLASQELITTLYSIIILKRYSWRQFILPGHFYTVDDEPILCVAANGDTIEGVSLIDGRLVNHGLYSCGPSRISLSSAIYLRDRNSKFRFSIL